MHIHIHKFADDRRLRIGFGTWETLNNSTAKCSHSACTHTMGCTAMDKTVLHARNMLHRTRKTNEFNPMEIVIYLCRLFTAVDGCGWMRWCAKCNLHKMKFRNSVSLRKFCWGFVLAFSPSRFLFGVGVCSMDIPCWMRCCWWKFTLCALHVECDILFIKSNETEKEKQNKTQHNIVSNVEAKSCDACVSEWVMCMRCTMPHATCKLSSFTYML